MCSSGINVCVQEKKYDVRNGGREKEIKSSEYMCVNLCVCVWMKDREMKAWKEIVRSWHTRWQLSAAVFHRPGIPHTPATLYMPTIPVFMCTWIILPTLFGPLQHLCYIICFLLASSAAQHEMKIFNLKKIRKPLNCQGDNVLNRFLASWGIKLLEVIKIPEYNPNKCFQSRGARFSWHISDIQSLCLK